MIRGVRAPLACLLIAVAWPLHAATEAPTDSLYRMRVALLAQNGVPQPFDLYRGHPTLISMFYGSCAASCPMLITSLQVYEKQLPAAARSQLRVLLISFDRPRDTPQRLAELAREHHADSSRWTFSSASAADARKIAALLGAQYRQLPDGSFDHSLLITLLDDEGRPLASTSKLIGDAQFMVKLETATASQPAPAPLADSHATTH